MLLLVQLCADPAENTVSGSEVSGAGMRGRSGLTRRWPVLAIVSELSDLLPATYVQQGPIRALQQS